MRRAVICPRTATARMRARAGCQTGWPTAAMTSERGTLSARLRMPMSGLVHPEDYTRTVTHSFGSNHVRRKRQVSGLSSPGSSIQAPSQVPSARHLNRRRSSMHAPTRQQKQAPGQQTDTTHSELKRKGFVCELTSRSSVQYQIAGSGDGLVRGRTPGAMRAPSRGRGGFGRGGALRDMLGGERSGMQRGVGTG
jgi:hypothetical protein